MVASPTSQPIGTPATAQPRWLATLQAKWTAFPDAPIPTASQHVTPTTTPFPLPTSPTGPAKQILVEFGVGGGDGGTTYDLLLGRDVPYLVLYSDGLLVMTGGPYGISWLVSKQLSVTQVCHLLQTIGSTGFFDAEGTGQRYPDDPIYMSYRDYGDGAAGYRIAVNGPRNKWVWVYGPAVENLVPAVAAALHLLDQYRPAGMQPYNSHRIILRVQARPGADWDSPTPESSSPWPADLPPLQSLVSDEEAPRDLLFQGTQADLLESFFPFPGSAYFTQNGESYFVVARPALPHETELYYSAFAWASSKFQLPFPCEY